MWLVAPNSKTCIFIETLSETLEIQEEKEIPEKVNEHVAVAEVVSSDLNSEKKSTCQCLHCSIQKLNFVNFFASWMSIGHMY